ncbi:MAG: ribosome-associated translation inhibitor RaiA [Ruminococcaceae bacterium]|nr:ribosome-associated translation inhibitor RaiA [Oscillospiraceae bacterium]
MKITTVGRKMEVPVDLKELFEKKLQKFDKFFKDEAEAVITLSKIKTKECLELMITANGTLFRSEESDSTFQNALDTAIDTIERQIRKNKTRLEKKFRDGSFDIESFLSNLDDAVADEEEGEFEIRTKTFSFKPMSVEEAILQMNLLRHEFFVFTNQETEDVNVVYRRNSGGYGLIIPG